MTISSDKIYDVIENDSLVYNDKLNFFDNFKLKNKQRTLTKRISAEELFKPWLSSKPLSIRFLSQETIAERVKVKPREKKTETGLKILTPNKLLTISKNKSCK